MSRKKDKKRQEKRSEKHKKLEQIYEEMYSPKERAAHQTFMDEWFNSIMPSEWENAPPSADIIDIKTRKKLD